MIIEWTDGRVDVVSKLAVFAFGWAVVCDATRHWTVMIVAARILDGNGVISRYMRRSVWFLLK